MTMEQRKLAQELAKKREQTLKQAKVQAKKSSTGEMKAHLAGQLTQRKDARKGQLEQLAREEARRRKGAMVIILSVVAVVVIIAAVWGLSVLKANRQKATLAEQRQQQVMVVERFVKGVMQDYAKTGIEDMKRFWQPDLPELVRSAGEVRIKAIEKPAGVVVGQTLPGNEADIYETSCSEADGEAFLVRVRYRDGTCLIVAIE